MAPMCNGPEPFEQFWKRVTQGTFLPSFIKFDQVVLEKKSIEWKVDDARTHGRTDGRTTDEPVSQKLTLSTLCSGELKIKMKCLNPFFTDIVLLV